MTTYAGRLGSLLLAICVAPRPASAIEFAYDFNEGGSNKAANLSKPGVCILTPVGFDAASHPPRAKSGAKVPDAGEAAHFLGRLFDAKPWPDKDRVNTYRYVTSNAGVDYSADGNAGTVAAWIRLDDGDDKQHPHIGYPLRGISWDEPASGGIRHLFGIRNGCLRFNDYHDPPGAGSDQYQSTVRAFGDGETGWHHVAVTWQDGGGCIFYLDGEQLGDALPGRQPGGTFVSTNPTLQNLALGNSPSPGAHGIWNGTLNGDLDEVYLNYGEAKDATFIKELMTKGVGGAVAAKSVVTFPELDMTAGPVHLHGRERGQIVFFTLTNTGEQEVETYLELAAPAGKSADYWHWQKNRQDVFNSAGPGSTFRHHRGLTIPAGQTKAVDFTIDCPHWNPYNRYPLTCRLTIGDTICTQTREIVGSRSRGVFLGQPRHSRDIKESRIGTIYPFEHGALPECLELIAQAGIKWNRAGVRFVSEKTDLGNLPARIMPGYDTYLENLRKNGIQLVCLLRGDPSNFEYTREYWKRAVTILTPFGVKHFETDNEPNGRPQHYGEGSWNMWDPVRKEVSPWIKNWVEFTNVSAAAIKEANPEAFVIAGAGFTLVSHRALETGLLNEDVDAISDHPYNWANMPEIVPFGGEHFFKRDGISVADDEHTYVSQMRMLKEKTVKAGRPELGIWQTEWGFPAYHYDGTQRFSKELMDKMNFNIIEMGQQNIFIYEGWTERTQAKYVARRLIETLAFTYADVTFNFCFNRGPSFDPHHPEHGGFSMTKTQDATPRPAYYTMQRICGLFSDGVKPLATPLKIEIPLDRALGRKGLAWTRPYAGHPRHWEGAVPLQQPTRPRKYAFTTPQGELMIAVWVPVHAEDERQPDFCDIAVHVTGYGHPIAIDMLTGDRRDLEWAEKLDKGATVLKEVTVPDYPVVIKMFPKK